MDYANWLAQVRHLPTWTGWGTMKALVQGQEYLWIP